MGNLVYSPNQFDSSDGRIYRVIEEGTRIGDLVNQYAKDGDELDVIVNGRRKTNLNYILKASDHVTIAVHIGGGGGGGGSKGVLRTIAMIIVVVVATIVTRNPQVGITLAQTFGGSAVAWGYAASAAIMVGGSLLVNAILPPSQAQLSAFGSESLQDSNTYGWNPSRNQITEGLTAPVLYGKTRITPQVISQYRDYQNNNDILNVLFFLTEGESSTVEDIKVNNINLDDVSGVPVYKQGDVTQTSIDGFDDSIYEISVNQELVEVGDEIIVTTNGNAVTKLGVGIVLAGGIYTYTQGYGELDTGYKIEFRITGSGDPWTMFSGQSATYTRNIYGEYIELYGWSNVWVRTATPNGAKANVWDYTLFATEEEAQAADPGSHVFARYRVVTGWHDVTETKAEAGFYHSAKSPDTLKFRQVHNATLTADQYDIRITRLIKYQLINGSTTYANNQAVSFIQEITEGSFTYPYTSIIGLKSIASDKIYGGGLAIALTVNRGNLRHYAGEYGVGSPTLRDSGNPAWACYDLLTNPMYGLGLSPSNIILADFTAWATFCDTNSLRCNIYFDQSSSAFEAMGKISILGYGAILPRGTNIGCVYEDASSMVYTFGMGNIIAGSFSMNYIDKQTRANVIEVTYYDESLEYDRRILLVRDGGIETDKDVTASVSLVGCTTREQARKYANRLMRSNKYHTRVVEFESDIEAIHCQVGDVVGVSHDMPQYGYSGRVISSTTTTVVLDQSIFLEAAKTYSVLIRHEDDALESKEIVSPLSDGDYSSLALDSGTWSQNPAYMATWNLATIATGIKKFRVLSISKSGDYVAKIKALEYRDEVFSDGDSLPDFPSDTLLESVFGLTAYVQFRKETDGAIRAEIRADWRGVSTEWRVNVSRSDGYSMPAWKTYVTRSDFTVSNLIPRQTDTYTITVTGLDGDTASVTVDMIIDPPDIITGIKASTIDQFVLVHWDIPFSEAKIKSYEVWKGLDFLNATFVGSSNSNFISFLEPDYGQQDYWIFAVNEFDGKGEPMPFQVTIEANPNYESENVVYIDGSGSGDDFYWDGEYLLGPIGSTATTWEDAIMDLYPIDFATKTMDDLIADYGYATMLDVLGATSDGVGDYTETIDLGVEYPKAEYRLSLKTIRGTQGSGKADVEASFQVSNDNVTYFSDVNALQQIGLGVRYIRIRLDFSGDGNTAIWVKPQIDILTKTIQQTGKLEIGDATNGINVPLTTSFVDVTGINITPKSSLPRYAVYDFDDVPNPTDFTVWLFDENGTKVTGAFNYIVTGI